MWSASDLRDSGARVGSFGYRITGILESEAQHTPQAVFVFNKKDVRHDKQKSEFRSQNPDEGCCDHFILASEICVLTPGLMIHRSSLMCQAHLRLRHRAETTSRAAIPLVQPKVDCRVLERRSFFFEG